MNDELRRLADFGAQPEGTGPFFRRPALPLAYVRQVHGARAPCPAKNGRRRGAPQERPKGWPVSVHG
ncbi:MAG: hypothetical protein ABF290_10715, partial [Thiogranum sp.]